MDNAAWSLFRKHHYLNHSLNAASRSYGAWYDGRLVGFCAVLHMPHPSSKVLKRVTRLVVLPDYQGVGIGVRLLDAVAKKYRADRFRFRIVTSTPALVHALVRDGSWKATFKGRQPSHGKGKTVNAFDVSSSNSRATFAFEFTG